MEGQKVGWSVGQHDEREGKTRGVITLAVSCTDQTDTQTERESWGDAQQLLTTATRIEPDNDGQTDDFISRYPFEFEQSISGYQLTNTNTIQIPIKTYIAP